MTTQAKKPAETQGSVDAQRVQMHLQSRFNPIRGLTPDKLVKYLEAFKAGYFRDAALVWDEMLERDDMLAAVGPQRCQAVSQLEYEILTLEDSPEAEAHKDALEYAYNNLTATHALELSTAGEAPTLFEQMASAIGMRWSCHEIVWRQSRSGEITADFIHTPLWFFEGRTGALRFLPYENALEGVDLAPDKWLVARGQGIMKACSVARMFKQMPLNDWLLYCEKFGIPGLHGKTPAAKDSPEWEAMVEALQNFGVDWSILTGQEATITPVTAGATGNQPHPDLVDRMDRAMARLWRGGDLSAMSKGEGAVGSNPQGSIEDKLLAADAVMISSALQRQFDRPLLRFKFGPDVKPLAYFKLKPPTDVDDKREIEIDEALQRMGVKFSTKDLRERYGRPEPDAGDEIATPSQPQAPSFGPSPFANQQSAIRNPQSLGSDAIAKATALETLTAAQLKTLQPLLDRIEKLETASEADFPAALQALQTDLPALYREIATDDTLAEAFESVLGAELAQAAEKKLSSQPAKQ